MSPFNSKTFFILTGILLVLCIPCYYAVRSYELGHAEGWGITVLFAKLFYVLRFPTHALMKSTFQTNGLPLFIIGLIINCCIYGIFFERIIESIKNRDKEDPLPKNQDKEKDI
jgi:hypothetical protein